MVGDIKENSIEWYTGEKTCTVSFSQQKYVNRIKRMAETHGELVEIVAENPDGSITAHIPLRALHLTIYRPNRGSFAGVDKEGEE